MTWIFLAIVSAFTGSLRNIHLKRYCNEIPADLLVFFTRFMGSVFLLTTYQKLSIQIDNNFVFYIVVITSCLLTAVATVIKITLIQKQDLSLSLPFLSFIPLFMLPWTIILLDEYPSLICLLGVLLICIGSYCIYANPQKNVFFPFTMLMKSKSIILMLVVSLILGMTTVGDKLAVISANSFTYIFFWTIISTIIMSYVLFKYEIRKIISFFFNKHCFLQSVLWIVTFYSQIYSIELSNFIEGSVIYVKSIIMLEVIISVIIGGSFFKEKDIIRRGFSSIIMISGSIIIIISMRWQ